MTHDAQIALTTTLLGMVVGPLLVILLNRFFGRPKEQADLVTTLQSIAEKAVDELAEARGEIAELRSGSPQDVEVVVTLTLRTFPMFEVTRSQSSVRPLGKKKGRRS